MGKEVRFVVVWSEEENSFHIDEVMADMLFDGDDVWNVDSSEWERIGDNETMYATAFSSLREKIGGN